MSFCVFPKEYISSIYDYDLEKFKALGIKVVALDIDNTLVAHEAPWDEKTKKLIGDMKQKNLIPVIISNNHKKRVSDFCEGIGVSYYIYDAKKPSPSAYKKLIKDINITPVELSSVGDQIFTDIIGGNTVNSYTILTKPLYKEIYFHIKLKRILEKPIIFLYRLIYGSKKK